MNTVEIDAAALEAEATAALAQHPQDSTQGVVDANPAAADPSVPAGGASQEEILSGYVMVCEVVVGQGCDALVPAWNVTPTERTKLSGAFAKAFLLWFPDQIIPPKYLALLAVAGVTFEIVNARRDPTTGKLKPARVAPDKPAATTQN